MRGNSDPIEAYEAGKAVLAGPDHTEPNQLDGMVEALCGYQPARSASESRTGRPLGTHRRTRASV